METKNLMTPLSKEEAQAVYGGNVWTWIKKHIFCIKEDEHSWESTCTAGYNGTTFVGVKTSF